MKYKIFDVGGDNGAEQFNAYADAVIASNQDAGVDYEQLANMNSSTEEESDYIKSLREYDEEQTSINKDNDFSQKFIDLEEKLDARLRELESSAFEMDPFGDEDEHIDYLNEVYNTANPYVPYNTETRVPYALPGYATTSPAKAVGRSRNNYGNIRSADGKFANYATPEEGRQALIHQLSLYQTGKTRNPVKPDSTLLQAMSVYAPASDNNNPKNYATFIAKKLGVSLDTPIKNIDLNKWADAIAQFEGNKNIGS